ncbi:MAG TPA: ferritin-like domain-containing protein [Abditibacterium sp.]|jgi:hypothetical protein
MNEFEKIQRDPVSRRAFLQRMGAAGLGVAAVSLLNGCGGGSSGGSNNNGGNSISDATLRSLPGKNANVKVLNYALTLEILEADLYRQALNLATGRALTADLAASPSAYTLQVPSGGVAAAPAFAYLRDFAFVEAAHRDFIRTTILSLNDTPVERNPKGYKFGGPVAADLRSILLAILPLEETGVRAYLGAAPFFVNFETDLTKTLIQAAVGIYSTEARHSAAIQYILGRNIGPNGTEPGVPSNSRVSLSGVGTLPYSDKGLGDTFEYFSTPTQVFNAVSSTLFVK